MATNYSTAKPGINYPQDFSLKSLVLLSPSIGSFDLKDSMIEITYFEDIFSNTITGRLILGEAEGFIEKLHLNGNEFIRLTFTKASDKHFIIDVLFRIYKISDRQLVNNMQTEGYILYFCSEELILSEQYKVSKSYPQTKISDIVTDITKNYLKVPGNKQVNVEDTKGIYDFVVPNFKPFEAINWLSTYAQSSGKGVFGSDMLFFENNKGYNFSSLQTLFNQSPYRTYNYEPKNIDTKDQPIQDKMYSVLSYKFMNTIDTLGAINSGQFANQLITVDPLLQRYITTNFNYSDYFEKSQSLNKYPIVNDMENRVGDKIYETPQAVIKVSPGNHGQKDVPFIGNKPGSYAHDIFAEVYIPNRTAQLTLSNYNKIKLVIDGDPGALAGYVINFNLLSLTPKSTDKKPDDFYSGQYLISAVKHSINIGGYTTVLEIVKDSVVKPYVTPDNTSKIWQNTVKGII
jgi:hypothetical protein